MSLITVREHARLTTGTVPSESLDVASIPETAFDWLCREAQRFRRNGAPLVQIEDRRWLRLDNYVGVLESPCGTRIEILPKHVDDSDDPAPAREVLQRMLRYALQLPVRETAPTALKTFTAPVSEWVIQQFLSELNALVRRGLRSDYRQVEEEVRFMRGRLLVGKQMRQPIGRQHQFHVEHQIFDVNRPENRLIAAALKKVTGMARSVENWRLANELEHLLIDVPLSKDVAGDFRRWSSDRLMSHYAGIRVWCEIILSDQNPTSVMGQWRGKSLLFPMERVFESYVEAMLRRVLPPSVKLRRQLSQHYLCTQDGERIFQLKPDFLVEIGDATWVVDAKWKRIDGSDRSKNYGLSQGDFYQLYAYGRHYLKGQGQMLLVYPRTASFQVPLEPFDMQDGIRLTVIPLDLESGQLIGVPPLGDSPGFFCDGVTELQELHG